GERIRHERAEGFAIEILDYRAAQRGLAGADVAGEDIQAFTPADPRQQVLERRRVRPAVEKESGIGRQAERLFLEAVERLVGQTARSGLAHASGGRARGPSAVSV